MFYSSSLRLLSCSAIRRIEARFAHLPLMQRAGQAAAELVSRLCVDNGAPILVLAGPGNNGGDAFAAAYYLLKKHFAVHVVFAGEDGALPHDAKAEWQRFSAAGGHIMRTITAQRYALILDGLFGIGLNRPLSALYSQLIKEANALAVQNVCPLLALDCPSGLHADTGQCLGVTIKATHTLSFIAAKAGYFTADGPDYCGQISVDTLGLDGLLAEEASAALITLDRFAHCLKARRHNSHKGSFGTAGLLGGSPSMSGALVLAARSALLLGSGRVYVGVLDATFAPLDPAQPELMFRRADELMHRALTVLTCGPGLTPCAETLQLLHAACDLPIPLVFDAGALQLLAEQPTLKQHFIQRQAPNLLTPHPLEAARLLGCQTQDIQADRLAAAQRIAAQYHAWVALKGCGTVLAGSDGSMLINTSGNAGLSTAGSGDVLSGLLTALLAQRWPAREALQAAVYIHGKAAERLVEQGVGPVGLSAGELIASARSVFNQLSVASS